MANSNAMARADADKNHVGADMLVLDSAGDVGKIALNGMIMAWVNFDGTAGSLAPSASANISSITDRGVGQYTLNFSNAMPDANYAVVVTGRKNDATDDGMVMGGIGTGGLTASSAQITMQVGSTGPDDMLTICAVIVR